MKYQNVKKRFYTFFLGTCFLIILFGIGEYIFLSLDGVYLNPPITIETEGKFTTQKEAYSKGETVTVKFSFCKHRNVVGTYRWEIINDDTKRQGFFLPQFNYLAVGCYKDLIVPVEETPTTVGIYHFVGTLSFEVNQLTTITVPLSTNSFTVK